MDTESEGAEGCQPVSSEDSQHPTHSLESEQRERLPITVRAKLLKALELKEEGNALFKQQKWKKAIRKYHHSLMYTKGITDRPDKLMGMDVPLKFLKPTEEEEKQAEELLVSAHNNIAACLVKDCEWERAEEHTAKVLELRPWNVKALFRQGLCSLNLGKLDQAGELLKKAETMDPNDIGIRKQLRTLQLKEEEEAKKEQTMYKAMFAQTS